MKATEISILIKQGDLNALRDASLLLADLDQVDDRGLTIHAAMKMQGQNWMDYAYELATLTLTKPDMLDERGRALIHWAAKCNQSEEIICDLLKNGANIDDARNSFQVTPLYVAAQEGNITAANALIALGANLTLPAINGACPIHAATDSGNNDLLKSLIDAGADVNARCLQGGTALIAAAQHANPTAIKLLLDARADVNHSTAEGATALFMAAQIGHAEIVSALLQAHANPSLALKQGVTPLQAAEHNQHQAVIDLLMTHTNVTLQ